MLHRALLHYYNLRAGGVAVCVWSIDTESPFEVLECNEHHCDIIECLAIETIFKDAFDTQTAMLVNWDWWLVSLIVWNGDLFFWLQLKFSLITRCPHRTNTLRITHLVEDPIRCQHHKIMLPRNPKLSYGWLTRDYIRVATSARKFSFRVTERSTHWESTRQHSDRADQIL